MNDVSPWPRRIARLRRLLPWLSFALGVGSFVLLERGREVARFLPLVLLAGWVLVVAERRVAGWLARLLPAERGRDAIHLVLQSIHQESFFFALPFLVRSTVWSAPPALFTSLVIAAGAISVLDPWYFGALSRRRGWLLAYHALALFVSLLVALPLLLAIDSSWTLALSAALTAALAVPTLRGWATLRGPRGWALVVGVALAVAALAWWGRAWVPPAPVRLADGGVTWHVDARQKAPGLYVEVVPAPALARGLVAYTAVAAPLGLRDRIQHVWLHEGRIVDRIPLEIRGGRDDGYRTWSRKRHFPANPVGAWAVEVRTHHDQRIGRIEFAVVATDP